MTVCFKNVVTGKIEYVTLASTDYMSPEWIAATQKYCDGDWRVDLDLTDRIAEFVSECSDDDFYDACEDVYNNFSIDEEFAAFSAVEFKFGYTE